MKIVRKIAIVLLAALIVIQFFHPKKNKSEGDQPNYIGKSFPMPDDVKAILAKACTDCHSNNTKYPWYTNIQPVHWFMDKHIVEGKQKLNLDEFTNKRLAYQYKKLEEIADEIKEGAMPLDSYLWIHKDAKLTDEEKLKVTNWTIAAQDSLKAHYPMDSLVRKRPPEAK